MQCVVLSFIITAYFGMMMLGKKKIQKPEKYGWKKLVY
jgi:hypothetical protein